VCALCARGWPQGLASSHEMDRRGGVPSGPSRLSSRFRWVSLIDSGECNCASFHAASMAGEAVHSQKLFRAVRG
jgi:hypothetical protein